MREMDLDEIAKRVKSKEAATEKLIRNHRRATVRDTPDGMSPVKTQRRRQRRDGERQLLDKLARVEHLRAVQEGRIHYDPVKRVFRDERLER